MNNKTGVTLYVYLVAAVAAIVGLLFGFDTGIISGALLFIKNDFVVSTEMKELIVGSVLIGAMAGSLSSGRLTDKFGRRRLMLICSGLFIVGTAIAALATQVQVILVGRLIIGLAIGMGTYTGPLYIAEIAPPHLRGMLVTFNQLMITIGILCSYIINYAFTNFDSSWRWMFGIGLVPALMLGLGMIFLPESPRWLLKQNMKDKAINTLKRLRNSNNVDAEVEEIKASLFMRHATIKEVFTKPILPVLLLGATLGFIQQATGINTIIYYAPTIFQMAGFQDTSTAILATVGIGVVNVLATVFAVFFLDTLGRRPLLLVGLIGMCLTLAGLSLAFHFGASSPMLRWIAVGCTFTYIICFAFSMGVMLWLLLAEIYPLEVRATAMSVAIFSCWFWNFVVASTFLTLLNTFGPSQTFMLYALMCVFGIVFCYYKVPETNGVTLEEIEEKIRAHAPVREIGQPASDPILATEAE